MGDSPGEKKRWTISERLEIDQAGEDRGTLWILSERLFGGMTEINDFEASHYNYFLDHVSSLNELITGLQELSPLADNALSIAENMNEREFQRFKSALKKERNREFTSALPKKFGPLLLPNNFISATMLAEKYEVALGVALIQLAEIKQQESSV